MNIFFYLLLFFASIAAMIHAYIFMLESIIWGTKKANRVFGVSQAEARINKTFAFNQGFYNLFLAVASVLGVILALINGLDKVSETLLLYSCTSMLAASLVLLFSTKKLLKPALIQGVPPGLALLFWFILKFISF